MKSDTNLFTKAVHVVARIFLFVLAFYIVAYIRNFAFFLACKLFGSQCSLGAGPTLLSFNIGESTFKFKAWPLGGAEKIESAFIKLSEPKQLMILLVPNIVLIAIACATLKYLMHQKPKKIFVDYARSSSELGDLVLAAAPVETLDTLRVYGDGLIGMFSLIGRTILRGWHLWLFIFGLLNLNLAMWGFINITFGIASRNLFALRDTLAVGESVVGAVSLILVLIGYFVGFGYVLAGRVRENV